MVLMELKSPFAGSQLSVFVREMSSAGGAGPVEK